MNKISQNLLLLMVALLPFERLLTFELAGFTVKPALLAALFWLVSIILNCTLTAGHNKHKGRVSPLSSSSAATSRQSPFKAFISGLRHLEPEEYLLISIVLWSFLSAFWSLNPGRTLVVSALLAFLATIFLLLRRFITEELRNIILKLIINLGIFVSIFAIIQFLAEPYLGYKIALLREKYSSNLFGFPRPHATFLEPLYLANFLIFPIIIGLRAMFEAKYRICWRVIIPLIAFILTLSRGAYLGLALAILFIIVVGLISKRVDWSYVAKIILNFVVAAIIAITMVLAIAGGAGLKTFYNHAISSSDLPPKNQIEVLQNRSDSQSKAWREFKKHPGSGIGLNAFGALPDYQLLRDNGEWQIVNNEYLELAVELGVVGLLLWLSFLFLIIKSLFSKIRMDVDQEIWYIAAMIAVLLQYLTFSGVYILYMWVFLALALPIYRARELRAKAQIS